jgi:hypothetical protein
MPRPYAGMGGCPVPAGGIPSARSTQITFPKRYLSKAMHHTAALYLLLAAGLACASPERNLAPAAQGPYLAWKGNADLNPTDLKSYSALGWRERIYESDNPCLSYNYLGVEFFGNLRPSEFSGGSRMLVQPTSFFSASLTYRLIDYPRGVVSFAPDERWTESEINERLWKNHSFSFSTFADEFSLKLSLHKDWGAWQWEFPLEWGRYDIRDDTDRYVYIPSYDLLGDSRDDFVRISPMVGYRFDSPFLFGVGLAHTVTWTVSHQIRNQRTGVVYQMWPFSERKEGELLRYWSLSTRFDIWTENEYKRLQPRVEFSLGWDRNLF